MKPLITFLIVLSLFLIVTNVAFYTVGYARGVLKIPQLDNDDISNLKLTIKYKYYEKLFINDTFIDEVTDFCVPFKNEEQVDCVVSYVSPRLKVLEHDDDFKSPSETITNGGVCRDYYLIYAGIFTKLGWKNDPIFTDNHVYNNIWNKETYCSINMKTFNCD